MQREKQPIKILRQSDVCHLAGKGVLKLFFCVTVETIQLVKSWFQPIKNEFSQQYFENLF